MITFLLICAVIGFLLFLFNRFAPVDGSIKSLITCTVVFVLVIGAILFILDLFELYHSPILRKFK